MSTITIISSGVSYIIAIPDDISDDHSLWKQLMVFLIGYVSTTQSSYIDFYSVFEETNGIWTTEYTYESVKNMVYALYYTTICSHCCAVDEDWMICPCGPKYHDTDDSGDSESICCGESCHHAQDKYYISRKRVPCVTWQYKPSEEDLDQFTLDDTECCCTLK
jgi:hypothetical protein